MERTITWIASLVALAILLLLPISYFFVHYQAVRSEMHLQAETHARLVTQLINAAPEMWQFQTERLDELLSRRVGEGTVETRRVRDLLGRTVATNTQLLDDPTMMIGQPVFDAGREVGKIEVERSLRPALLGSGLAALLAALLSGAVFVALRLLPLRALRRAEKKAIEQSAHAAWLEKANREATEAARLQSHFLARLTHEIRSPLGGLLGMNEALRGAQMTPAQWRDAQQAHHSGSALLQIVNDIADYSLLQSNELAVVRTGFDPIVLVESVIEKLTSQAVASGLTLYYQVGPGLPAEMEGDSGRLRQVLNNLVGNALKYTPQGDVKIVISWVAATMTDPAAIHFEVRDTGIGLSPQEQARLFQPFLHVAQSAVQHRSGAGLGLAISRQLVQLMGGQIGLQSKLGRGSNFWFELPQTQRFITPSQTLPADAAGAPLHVLVADPHTGRARALCCRLLALGVRVNAVHNSSALRTVLAKPRHIFTHVMALATLHVNPQEGEQLRWITLHESNQQTDDWGRESGPVSLTLPCRREDLIQGLLGARPMSAMPGDELPRSQPAPAERRFAEHPEHPEHPAQPPQPRDDATAPRRAAHTEAPTVLLVESNEVSQEVGRALLESMGCEVCVAADGHEALQRLPQGFALILLDLQMSGMDGFTTAREIRHWEALQPAARRTLLVALTADKVVDVQARCDAAGMDDIVGKPVNLEALRDTLERHLPQLAAA